MCPRRVRAKAKIAAPTKVNARLSQYAPRPCGSMPTRIATVAPRAAIWARARSTKITPRSTTCTPRYAWMPVRIRLAMKGQSKNGRISMFFLRLLECLLQQIDIVIEELKIGCHLFFPAHRRQIYEHFCAGGCANAVGGFQVKVRFDQNQLAILPLHQSDE